MLNNFENKYEKGKNFKEFRQEPAATKKYGKKIQVNAIARHAVDEIILQETDNEKLICKK